MIKLGKYQTLTICRFVDFGAYLSDGETREEVLIPARYIPEDKRVGDTIEVFVYKDSLDRPVATTEHPYATVGEFAYLQVKSVSQVGAFLDWGVMKDLLVPFSEQKCKMIQGGIYLVYIYVDNASGRIVASARIERFLGNVIPDYKPGSKVKALVYEHTPIGYKAIVDNLHRGIIYSNELFRPIEVEESVTAFVKRVREDGKIDLTLSDKASKRTEDVAGKIMRYLSEPGAKPVGDRTSPEFIQLQFSCSKKDFKKAIGHLYKQHLITIAPDGTIAPA